MQKYDRIYNLTISQLQPNQGLMGRYTKSKGSKEYKLDIQQFFNTDGIILNQKVYSAIADSIKVDKRD